jgi:hypothetical protein
MFVGRQDIQKMRTLIRIIFGKVGIIWIYSEADVNFIALLFDRLSTAHSLAREKEREWYKYYSNTMTDAESQVLEERMKLLFDQIERNLVYSSNESYSKEERVKTFKFTRDDLIYKQYLERIPHCL